jgi:hypothetical protein
MSGWTPIPPWQPERRRYASFLSPLVEARSKPAEAAAVFKGERTYAQEASPLGREQKMMKARTLYSSPTGERWFLIRNASGEVFVRPEANSAAGGSVDHIEIGAFLSSGRVPEHQELFRLIGSLLDDETAHV